MIRSTCIRSVELSLDQLLNYIPDDVYLTIKDKLGCLPEKANTSYNENLRCVVFSTFSEDTK